jgi:hypothetical protein
MKFDNMSVFERMTAYLNYKFGYQVYEPSLNRIFQ